MDPSNTNSGSLKPPEPANPPKKKQYEPAAPKPEWDLQESRGRSSRHSLINKRSADPEIQERRSWWEHGWIPASEWKRCWLLDDATGEWIWIGCPKPKQTTPGSQRWSEQKKLDKRVADKEERLEENWKALFDAKMQFWQLSEGTNLAQTSTFKTLQMREYAVAAREDYWKATYQQLSAMKEKP